MAQLEPCNLFYHVRGRGNNRFPHPPLLNADGDMVPLGAVADVRESAGPVQSTRYNMFPAAPVTGVAHLCGPPSRWIIEGARR